MKTDSLSYDLPAELIAQRPVAVRSDSRLLVLDRTGGGLTDSAFNRIGDFLNAGDCLVLNDTKVLPARFFASRPTGAKIEGLFIRQTDDGLWEVMLKGLRKVKLHQTLTLKDRQHGQFCKAEIIHKRPDGKCLLRIEAAQNPRDVLDRIGYAPLPPYIKRDDDPTLAGQDRDRYQTVYARAEGAIAAPTAGLHFTPQLLDELCERGIAFARVTLHVGEGTFKPVTTDELDDHTMHGERFEIDETAAQIINRAKRDGGRIIAVGTTSTRVLETVARAGQVSPSKGVTGLFIKPGYAFKFVDAMVTNFHLPKSTLLALVAAFAGLETILAAYQHAVAHRYRFYSYGDAMLII